MPKIKIDLNKDVLDFENGETKPLVMRNADGSSAGVATMRSQLANMLKYSRTGDAVKYLGWVIDLGQTGVLEVDEADYQHLVEFVNKNDMTSRLVAGQILREMQRGKG